MTELSRQHAVERHRILRLPPDYVLLAYDLVEAAVGQAWLDEQEQRSVRQRYPITDAETIVRLLATPTDEAHIEICELAHYLRTFSADPAIPSVIEDLRTHKYAAVLFELAMAYRWRDAGAAVSLRPATAKGVADFDADISGLTYTVEASSFPNEIFKQLRFRLPLIYGDAVASLNLAETVKLRVVLGTYPAGNVEAVLRSAVIEACRKFNSSSPPGAIRHDLGFGSIDVEPLISDPEFNPFLADQEEQEWDICFRHVQRRLRVGEPIYRALEEPPVREVARIYARFPRDDRETYELIYKKLKREASQLSGVPGPRVVLLDSTALGDVFAYNEQLLKSQLVRVMRQIPELAAIWICMRQFTDAYRYKYFSLFVPNPDSTFQLPMNFMNRCATREWKWDHLADDLLPDFK